MFRTSPWQQLDLIGDHLSGADFSGAELSRIAVEQTGAVLAFVQPGANAMQTFQRARAIAANLPDLSQSVGLLATQKGHGEP